MSGQFHAVSLWRSDENLETNREKDLVPKSELSRVVPCSRNMVLVSMPLFLSVYTIQALNIPLTPHNDGNLTAHTGSRWEFGKYAGNEKIVSDSPSSSFSHHTHTV